MARHRLHRSPPAIRLRLNTRPPRAALDPKEHRELPDTLAVPVTPELQEPQETQAVLRLPLASQRLLLHATRAQPDHPARLAHPARTEMPASLVSQEAPDTTDNPDKLAPRARPVLPASPVVQDSLVSLDSPAKTARRNLEPLARPAMLEHLVNPDSPAPQDKTVALAPLDPRDLPARPDSLATMVTPDNLASLVNPEALARRASAPSTAPSTAESFSRTELVAADQQQSITQRLSLIVSTENKIAACIRV